MTPVPVVRAVISLTTDRTEVLQENGKLIYLNFHPEQTVHPRNPMRRCSVRLESRQSCPSLRALVERHHSNQQLWHLFTALHH